MVRTPHFQCWGPGSIPGQGTKILQAARHGQKKERKKKKKKKGKNKQNKRYGPKPRSGDPKTTLPSTLCLSQNTLHCKTLRVSVKTGLH